MFQLQKLTHFHWVKWPVKLMFLLLIISFIFFYGWSSASNNREQQRQQIDAKLRSTSLNPFDRWEYLDAAQIDAGRKELLQTKVSLLGQQGANLMDFVNRNGLGDRLVSTREASQQAADNVILQRRADHLGLQVSRQDVISQLQHDPGMNPTVLSNLAAQSGFANVNDFIDFVAQEMTATRVQDTVALVGQASFYELWQEYSLDKEKFTLQMVAYPATNFEAKVPIEDAALDKYLADHRDQFKKPDQRRYDYVKITHTDLLAKIVPTEDQLKAYYDENKAKYEEKAGAKASLLFVATGTDVSTTKALDTLAALRAEADARKDWQGLANELQTTRSMPVKVYWRGDGWLTYDQAGYSQAFRDRLKTLTVDEVSTPILESGGAYLIRIIQKRDQGNPPLDQIRSRVSDDYRDKKADDQLTAEADRWTKEMKAFKSSKQTTPTLHGFALQLGVDDKLTTYVATSQFDIPGIGDLSSDSEYLNTLTPNMISEVIKLPSTLPTSLVVLSVADDKPSYDPPLSEVRSEVTEAYRSSESQKMANAAADQSLKLIQGGADFKTATADSGTSPQLTQPFTRTDTVNIVASKLIDFAPQTRSLAVGSTGVSAYGLSAQSPFGYAVWKVAELQPPALEDFAKDRYTFERQYLQLQRVSVLREWLDDQRKKAEYKYSGK